MYGSRSCMHCGKSFGITTLRQTMYAHQRVCMENPDRLTLKCDICNCTLMDRTSVRRHYASRKHQLVSELRALTIVPKNVLVERYIVEEDLPIRQTVPKDAEKLFGKDVMEAGPFQVIYADPPWQYRRNAGQGVANNHYSTMSDAEIAAMPVGALAAKDCALLMWATSPKLPDAIKVVKSWGFEYKTVFFTWIKTDAKGKPLCGLGSYTRSSTEICLIGVRGNVMPWKQSNSVQQTILSPRRQHSRKPVEARERIETFFGAHINRIELFAREPSVGWHVWGDDTSKFLCQ